jgi:hypothetical protein
MNTPTVKWEKFSKCIVLSDFQSDWIVGNVRKLLQLRC